MILAYLRRATNKRLTNCRLYSPDHGFSSFVDLSVMVVSPEGQAELDDQESDHCADAWKAIDAAARSVSVMSDPIFGFMMETRDWTWL
jgi:hypothetical protein